MPICWNYSKKCYNEYIEKPYSNEGLLEFLVVNALMLFLPIPEACFIGYIHSIPQRNSPDWIQRNTTITPPHPQPITTTTSTNHTPIAQPHTTSSCELTATKWGKTGRFLPHEVLECSRASTKWTSTKWTSRVVANKARACSKSVCCERGRKRRWVRWEIRRVSSEPCRVCAKTPWGFRSISDVHQYFRNLPQYHKYSLTIPPITWWFHKSPDFTGFHRTIPGTT